jgi:hypothetical protein
LACPRTAGVHGVGGSARGGVRERGDEAARARLPESFAIGFVVPGTPPLEETVLS